jgi:Fatty acid hydroxylase
MSVVFIWFAAGFLFWTILDSFMEWLLHRYVMHRPLGKFRYPFRAHALVHHRVFRADDSYHLQCENDKETIPMAWWNGPVLVTLAVLPALPLTWVLGSWSFLAGAAAATIAYFGMYEYLHWCMHLPKQRVIERSGLFFRLNGHHLLHHRYMHKNFNVVLPLADLCFGTLLLRSKVHFAQARGPAVRDVQPLATSSDAKRRVFDHI